MAKKTERATIEDVAQLAGVSIATVSAVINGNVPVSVKRTKMVRDAMSQLNYRRNERGRSLRTGRSMVLGVVVPDIANPFFPQLLHHLEECARASGYSLMLCDAADSSDNERRQVEMLHGRGVDGVLITLADSAPSFDWLNELELPAVFVERGPLADGFTTVSTDNVGASSIAARHFLELGHERIAILLTRGTGRSNIDRIEGFCRALESAGIAVPPEFIQTGFRRPEDTFEAATDLLRQPDRPTALICGNALLLLGAARAARELGLNCPEDISIIGFDHTAWTENFNPPMTTMKQQTDVVARLAVNLLLAKIRGEDVEAPPLVAAELCVRSSTAPARVLAGR